MGPGPKDYLNFLFELISGERYRIETGIAAARERAVGGHLDHSQPLRILDLANGRLRPQSAILAAGGHRVVGVDLVNRPGGSWINLAYRVARSLFEVRLRRKPWLATSYRLVCASVDRLPFPSESFDLVTSIAAFEHFLDVPLVVQEVHRILRPGGLAYCGVHHFSSLSGGHNVQLIGLPITRLPDGVDAWDHLRRRKLPFHVPLNEWRPHQYREEFSAVFDIISFCLENPEGEGLLTAQVEAELPAYSREELTHSALILVVRKRELHAALKM